MAEPMYRRIADDIRSRIESGELAPGMTLPSEIELRDQYSCSRNTVRDAIKILSARGLVETRAGQGTFVTRKIDPSVTILGLDAFDDDQTESHVFVAEAAAAGKQPRLSSPSVELTAASESVATRLRLTDEGNVVRRQQQRWVDGTPWAIQTYFFPFELVARGATSLLQPTQISEGEIRYLADVIGVRQAGWRDVIAVRLPDAAEANFFDLPEDGATSVFEIQRTSYDQAGMPFRLAVMTYPADRHTFVISPAGAGNRATVASDDSATAEENPDSEENDERVRADAALARARSITAELDAQNALAQRSFDEAVAFLREAVRADPGRAEGLQPDLNCLSRQPGDSPGRLAWRRGLWLALGARSPLALTPAYPADPGLLPDTVLPLPDIVIPPLGVVAAAAAPSPAVTESRGNGPAARTPQQKGADLEGAFIKLLRRFFALTSDDETQILERLRQQSSGTQFGHDVQFDCVTAKNRLVRCHVECKNYTRDLKPADLYDKIMQTQTHWERKQIDYLVIVTPHGPASAMISTTTSRR